MLHRGLFFATHFKKTFQQLIVDYLKMSTVCARRGLFSAEAILAARTENRKMNKETNGERNGQEARSPRGVINRPATSRTRVVCHTGVNMPSLGIPSAGAGARSTLLFE